MDGTLEKALIGFGSAAFALASQWLLKRLEFSKNERAEQKDLASELLERLEHWCAEVAAEQASVQEGHKTTTAESRTLEEAREQIARDAQGLRDRRARHCMARLDVAMMWFRRTYGHRMGDESEYCNPDLLKAPARSVLGAVIRGERVARYKRIVAETDDLVEMARRSRQEYDRLTMAKFQAQRQQQHGRTAAGLRLDPRSL